jgi:hypothetical protein
VIKTELRNIQSVLYEIDTQYSTSTHIHNYIDATQYILATTTFRITPTNFIISQVWGKGKWIGMTYVFDATLSPFDRANEKFRYCGAYSLCAKTPNYIGVYKLKNCELSGIEFVKLNKSAYAGYEPSGFLKDIFGTVEALWNKIESGWLNMFMDWRRFYLVSPCGYKFKITLDECECSSERTPIYNLSWHTGDHGEIIYESKILGFSRKCDEPGIKRNETVKCLVVTPIEPLPGYRGGGGKEEYYNFCFSLPENAMRITDTAITITAIATQIGLAFATGGTSAIATGVVSSIGGNFLTGFAIEKVNTRFTWPHGIIG